MKESMSESTATSPGVRDCANPGHADRPMLPVPGVPGLRSFDGVDE